MFKNLTHNITIKKKMSYTQANIQCVLACSDLRGLEEMEKVIKLCVDFGFSISQVREVFSVSKNTLYHKVKANKKGKTIERMERKKILSNDQKAVVVK
jgi:hypothetical protein